MQAKAVTVYAQWKKVTRTLSTSEKALIGNWSMVSTSGVISYEFISDGTFSEIVLVKMSYSPDMSLFTKGLWYESGGTIYMTNRVSEESKDDGKTWSPLPSAAQTDTLKCSMRTDEYGKQYLETFNSVGEVRFYKS